MTRAIKTEYYPPGSTKSTHTNYASSIRAAHRCASDHMGENHYGAAMCEITDRFTGQLYEVLTYSANGELRIAFKYNKANPVCLMME